MYAGPAEAGRYDDPPPVAEAHPLHALRQSRHVPQPVRRQAEGTVGLRPVHQGAEGRAVLSERVVVDVEVVCVAC